MGLGSKIKKAVKKVTKAVTKTITEPIKAGASVANEIAKVTGIDAVEKVTGEIKNGVYKAADVVVTGAVNTVDAAMHPGRAVNDFLHNPLTSVMHLSGLEELYKGKGAVNAVTETPVTEASNAKKNDEQSAQDRARMLSRQGMQGANPIMLLGQEFQPSELATDEELGGKGQ